MTSCSPAVERNTHKYVHTLKSPHSISSFQAHTNIHTACSAQLKCRRSPGLSSVSSLCSPCSCSCLPPAHLPLYLLSAIRASDDNTGRKCCHGNTIHHILLPTPAFSPVVGPWQEQLIQPLGASTKELMELEVSPGERRFFHHLRGGKQLTKVGSFAHERCLGETHPPSYPGLFQPLHS